MSEEPDCTGSEGSSYMLEPSLSIIQSKSNLLNNNNNNNNENSNCDLEKAVCASTNNNNNNNLNNNNNCNINNNLSTSPSTNSSNNIITMSSHIGQASALSNLDEKMLLKCDRCESFETISHALLLVHVSQCRSDLGNSCGSSSRKSMHDIDNHMSFGTDSENDLNKSMGDGGLSGIATSSTSATNLTIDNNSSSSSSSRKQSIASDSIASTMQNASGQQQQSQHQRKLFECDVCNMKFSNGANMRRHKMRHTGVKPYECRVCQKRFFRKDHLAEHFTTHTKTLPYHCPICNRGFQRQIAMRAHFQNEHVGQHDLVKTCPLCSYRAGTMKSLRIHFFNRHGIDLDNPGPNAPSSLLLALDPTNSGSYLPSIALAAAAVAANAANAANNSSLLNNGNSNSGPTYSDSGDSLRSADNATPPMHFLTPHVEISMAESDNFKSEPVNTNATTALELQSCSPALNSKPLNGGSPSPHSADSNSNTPSSSQSLIASQSSRSLMMDGQITPSISLIPIKQEPQPDDYESTLKSLRSHSVDHLVNSMHDVDAVTTNAAESSCSTSSNLTSLIKVSPLKSLLREDLKRRISARATSRNLRNSNNSLNLKTMPPTSPSISNSRTHTSNSNSSSILHSHSLLSAVASTESATISSMSSSHSTLSAVATTSNGAITSTGPENEMTLPALLNGQKGKQNLQCLFCGIEFPDQTLYFLHKGCHSESNPWKCNICGEQCNNVYEFNSHLLSKSHQ